MTKNDEAFNFEFLCDLEKKKNELDIDEWAISNLEEFRATDSIECTICGIDKPEVDMLKVFKVWVNGRIKTNKGICKRCWNFDEEEE
jgi:hypothetical protein